MTERRIPDSMIEVNYIKINGGSDDLMIKEGHKYPLYKSNTLILEQNASKELLAMADNQNFLIKVRERDGKGSIHEVLKYRVERVTKIENRITVSNMPKVEQVKAVSVVRENGNTELVESPQLNEVGMSAGGVDAVMAHMARSDAAEVISQRPRKKNRNRT